LLAAVQIELVQGLHDSAVVFVPGVVLNLEDELARGLSLVQQAGEDRQAGCIRQAAKQIAESLDDKELV
jgi:hypothetical protein